MANQNWKKIWAMKKQSSNKLHKMLPNLNNNSGIYVFMRKDENNISWAYCGQALHLEDRLVSHLTSYAQRIDISIRKRGFYDETKNPYGWKLKIWFYDKEELDDKEQEFIKKIIDGGIQIYNKTLGSQGEGKIGISDTSSRGYMDGLKQGYKKCQKEVKEFFDKYLEFRPKQVFAKPKRKNDEPQLQKIYVKKFDEFMEFLNGGNEDEQKPNE